MVSIKAVVLSTFLTIVSAAPAALSKRAFSGDSLGCYANSAINGYEFTSNSMTLEKCSNYCASYKTIFFGLTNGNTCDCSNAIVGVWAFGGCYSGCTGNSNQDCGGWLVQNVYAVDYSSSTTTTSKGTPTTSVTSTTSAVATTAKAATSTSTSTSTSSTTTSVASTTTTPSATTKAASTSAAVPTTTSTSAMTSKTTTGAVTPASTSSTTSSPAATSPAATSPTATSPAAASPAATSRAATSPAATSLAAASPAATSLAAASPAATSPSSITASANTSAATKTSSSSTIPPTTTTTSNPAAQVTPVQVAVAAAGFTLQQSGLNAAANGQNFRGAYVIPDNTYNVAMCAATCIADTTCVFFNIYQQAMTDGTFQEICVSWGTIQSDGDFNNYWNSGLAVSYSAGYLKSSVLPSVTTTSSASASATATGDCSSAVTPNGYTSSFTCRSAAADGSGYLSSYVDTAATTYAGLLSDCAASCNSNSDCQTFNVYQEYAGVTNICVLWSQGKDASSATNTYNNGIPVLNSNAYAKSSATTTTSTSSAASGTATSCAGLAPGYAVCKNGQTVVNGACVSALS